MKNIPNMQGLPELREIERLVDKIAKFGQSHIEGHIEAHGLDLPIYSFALGHPDRRRPALVLVGGVHGLERIGTRVLLAYLHTIANLLTWDQSIHKLLEVGRLLFFPLVNPGGMLSRTRSNPNGVDLMRNAPVESPNPRIQLIAGHRISPRLPWYRGPAGGDLEPENRILRDFLIREIWDSQRAISLDVHSGFGLRDRFWFPWAKSREPFPHIAEAFALRKLLKKTYPHHIYKFEPQSCQYVTHGDFWDYMYELHLQERKFEQVFLPFSLELGSWNWVRKNPKQMLSILGIFNPVIEHREQRTLRRHLLLFEFLFKAVLSPSGWAQLDKYQRAAYTRRAILKWFH